MFHILVLFLYGVIYAPGGDELSATSKQKVTDAGIAGNDGCSDGGWECLVSNNGNGVQNSHLPSLDDDARSSASGCSGWQDLGGRVHEYRISSEVGSIAGSPKSEVGSEWERVSLSADGAAPGAASAAAPDDDARSDVDSCASDYAPSTSSTTRASWSRRL